MVNKNTNWSFFAKLSAIASLVMAFPLGSSALAQGLPNTAIPEEVESMLTAFMYSGDYFWEEEVPEAWESTKDYSYFPAQTGEPSDERGYGAFTVANLNDTDSDGIIDKDDLSVVKTNDESEHETDLFVLEVRIPAQWVPGRSVGTLKAVDSGVFFWKNPQKMEGYYGTHPCTEIPFHEIGVQPNQTLEVWVEVTVPSVEIADKRIEFIHTLEDDFNPLVQADFIDVTGVWCGGSSVLPPSQLGDLDIGDLEDYVATGGGARVSRFYELLMAEDDDLGIPPLGANQVIVEANADTLKFEVNDWIVIFDDNNGELWSQEVAGEEPRQDTTRTGMQARISNIWSPAPNPGGVIVITLDRALMSWVNEEDTICYGLYPQVSEGPITQTYEGVSFTTGNARDMPFCKWGIQVWFQASPTGITTKPMSNGNLVKFDVTRQVERFSYSSYLHVYELTSKITMPKGDELPNDDGIIYDNAGNEISDGSNDEDNEPEEGGLDLLFSIDGPGAAQLIPAGARFETRFNAFEFVRVSFNNARPKGDNQTSGSRCSGKLKWCTTIDSVGNPDRFDAEFGPMACYRMKNPNAVPVVDETGVNDIRNSIHHGRWVLPPAYQQGNGLPTPRHDDLDF